MGCKIPTTGMTEIQPLTEDEVRAMQAAGHPLVMSYGMGVDSTAALIGMHRVGLRPDAILFADVGGEKDITYAYREIMNKWLASVDFPLITVVSYPTASETGRTRKIDPRTGEMYTDLAGQCFAQGNLPSLAYGRHQCSIKWKGDSQDRWLKSWGPAATAWANGTTVLKGLGYDCGKADSKRGMKSQKHEPKKYDWYYPLRWWGWTREDCERVIAEAGLPVPEKSSCYFCPAMKPDEVRWLAKHEPHNLRKALDLEANAALHPFTKKGLVSPIETGGLWTRISPGKDYPSSWREFVEREGLLEDAPIAGTTRALPVLAA